MKLKICICRENEKSKKKSEKQIKAAVKSAAELWATEKKEEAAEILIDLFQNNQVPYSDFFTPYVEKLGMEYCDLMTKLYMLRINDEDVLGNLEDFLNACPGDMPLNTLAAYIVGDKWDEVREKFYGKCPQCMFMGKADESYSLKLRSQCVVECIPEDCGLHELSGLGYMDGFSSYEGFALVKDDPGAKEKYPAKIKAILNKIKARDQEHFPNLIFPLTQGENMLDTCNQMLDLLELLDYGYHFENISSFISNHPKLFPDQFDERRKIIKALAADIEDDSDSDDDDIFSFDEDEDLLDDEPKSSGKKKSRKKK